MTEGHDGPEIEVTVINDGHFEKRSTIVKNRYLIKRDETTGKYFIRGLGDVVHQGPSRTVAESIEELEATFGPVRKLKSGELDKITIAKTFDIRELDPESQEPPMPFHELSQYLEANYEMPKPGETLYRLRKKGKENA